LATNMLPGKLGKGYKPIDLFKILSFLENEGVFILPQGQQTAIIERICGALGVNSEGYRKVKNKTKEWDTNKFTSYIKEKIEKPK
jgi:hypothetical protein